MNWWGESVADEIKALDVKLVGDLFGSAYVMDFTNPSFADFFRDIGIDIYNDAYLVDNGTSKGKRLRAFMRRGQKAAILKALYGLWEWRVHYIAGQPDPVPDGLERLNELIARLGGKPIAGKTQASATPASPISISTAPSEKVLAELEQEFMAMHSMDDAPQARGYAFERFLNRWFDAWDLEPRKAFKIVGEQIDGSFMHRASVYLLEAKWRSEQTNAASLRSFQGLVGDRLEGSRGLFVSYSGFTGEALQTFVAKRVVLMDGMDVYDALRRRLSLDEVVAKKLRIAVEERRPNVSVRELFP